MDRTLSAYELLRGADSPRLTVATPVSRIVGWGVRAPDNIGAIIRLAANFGCPRVLFVEEPGVPHNMRRIRKSAVDGPTHVEWAFVTPAEFIEQHAAAGPIVGLETSRDSVALCRASWPEACTLMAGSESHGLPAEAVALCASMVHIPVGGPLPSLNVSHALAVALFAAANR